MLFQLAFRESQREVRSVNRNVESLQNVGQRAEMIFMAVGENDRGDLVAILFDDFEIRNANIDAVDALCRKAHAGAKHEHLIAKPQQGTVHSESADAAEGHYYED